jgi:hypothetical protein
MAELAWEPFTKDGLMNKAPAANPVVVINFLLLNEFPLIFILLNGYYFHTLFTSCT